MIGRDHLLMTGYVHLVMIGYVHRDSGLAALIQTRLQFVSSFRSHLSPTSFGPVSHCLNDPGRNSYSTYGMETSGSHPTAEPAVGSIPASRMTRNRLVSEHRSCSQNLQHVPNPSADLLS
jgi:hypothetical protein